MQGKVPTHSVGADCSESSDALYRQLKPGPGMSAAEVAGHQQARIHSAMVELVAERGYAAVTVRDLARAAGVSTRSFYRHYPSKEQCFLSVHQLIARRVLRALELPPGMNGQDERARFVVEAAMEALACEPKAARLLLVDVYAAGPLALKQARRARKSSEIAIAESFAAGLEATAPSPLAAEGIIAGLYGVALRRLLAEKALPGVDQCADLAEWALAYCGSTGPKDLERISTHRVKFQEKDAADENQREWVGAHIPSGDLKALLDVVAKFAASGDHEGLSSRKLIEAAGVPRRTFDSNFSSLEDCFCAALEVKVRGVMSYIDKASESGVTPRSGVALAITALCDCVSADTAFASLCFDDCVVQGVQKIRHDQAFIDHLVLLISNRLSDERPVDRLRLEASVCSTWRAIQNQVTMGRSREVVEEAPLLAYHLLASIGGPPAPKEATRRDFASSSCIKSIDKSREE